MQKEGSKLREDDGILKRETHGSLKTLKTEVTFDLTKLHSWTHYTMTVTRCSRCGTGLRTEASVFLFAQISLE